MTDEGYRSYVGDEVITGEGVAVEVPAASALIRCASGLIDLIALVIIAFLVAFATSYVGGSEALGKITALLSFIGIFVALPTLVETLTRGRSLGKLACGLRTVRDDGGPITMRHALTRALVSIPEVFMLAGAPAVLAMFIHPRAKRLGDMAAGTYVISQRAKLALPYPLQMPPGLHDWAIAADIATLPSPLAVAVRQFLARAGSMTPAARQSVGQDLLAAVLTYVSPPPPAFAPPEYVLAAVIADRRRRDLIRLEREQRLRATVLTADPLS